MINEYKILTKELSDKLTPEHTISAKEFSDKLTNLAVYMPKEKPKIYAIASYLALRLGDGILSPKGFVSAFEYIFYDMYRGVDGCNGNSLPENLRDPLGVEYSIAYRKVPQIAKAICPEEFAKEVAQECIKSFRRDL